jgi:vitellogenic carboxypeptidase-like protein
VIRRRLSANAVRLALAALVLLVLSAGAAIAHIGSGAPRVAAGSDRVTALPTLGAVSQPEFAGYASVTSASCSDLLCSRQPGLFYWLVGQSADYRVRPTLFWSNGGPGASSMYGFFSENGPYKIDPMGGLVPYPDSWSKAANYLVFDHPLGVGLSFPTGGRYPQNLRQGIDQLRFAMGHVINRDGLKQSPLFLSGESYGGTYVPLLARQILNANKRGQRINLRGIVIVDGWVDPEVQVSTTATYALTHGLISEAQKAVLDRVFAQCQRAMRGGPPSSLRAGRICQSIQDKIAAISGRWLGNIGMTGDIDYTPIETYLNRPDVRAAIHAKPGGKFSLGSDQISRLYERGVMDPYGSVVAELLARHLPVMVISGLNDAKDANFLGTRKWIATLRWPGGARYRAAATKQWKSDGLVLGYTKTGGGLTSVEALNTGHLAPRDQPRLIDLIQQFMAHNS